MPLLELLGEMHGGIRDLYPGPIDTRLYRLASGISALLLLAAFTFSTGELIVMCLVVQLAILLVAPLPHVQARLARISSWLGRQRNDEDLRPLRFATIINTAFVSIALAAWWTGLSGLAWLVVLASASLAALHSVTGICIAGDAYARAHRARRGES
ncbi:MAG: DUF4395 family protein [Acidimicrobiia bacterium]